jgi:hypothetical protein
VGLQEGLFCGVGPVTQGGSLALRLYYQAVRHHYIFGMATWLSDGQCQEETKQNTNISMLRDNSSNVHYSHHGCGSTHLSPPLDLVVQSEASSVANRPWILGSWSYLHPNRGRSSILMRLQHLDPVFNMRVDVMRPAFNLET